MSLANLCAVMFSPSLVHLVFCAFVFCRKLELSAEVAKGKAPKPKEDWTLGSYLSVTSLPPGGELKLKMALFIKRGKSFHRLFSAVRVFTSGDCSWGKSDVCGGVPWRRVLEKEYEEVFFADGALVLKADAWFDDKNPKDY